MSILSHERTFIPVKDTRERLKSFVLERVVTGPHSIETVYPASFSLLRSLVHEQKDESHPDVQLAIDEAARSILEQVKAIQKPAIGLSHVLDSIDAWDVDRSTDTNALAVFLLNEFPGQAQSSLCYAFMDAKESGQPFDEALDTYNERHKTDIS